MESRLIAEDEVAVMEEGGEVGIWRRGRYPEGAETEFGWEDGETWMGWTSSRRRCQFRLWDGGLRVTEGGEGGESDSRTVGEERESMQCEDAI